MSNELAQAVEDLKGFSKLFKSIVTLCDAVENAEAVGELAATHRRNIAALEEKTTMLQDGISLLNAQHTEAVARFDEAKAEAAKNVALNAEEAQRIIAEASAKADEIVAKANEHVASLESKVASLEADCNTLTLARTKLENEYLDADSKLQAKKDEIRAIAG
jgi:chromosome segregation ATPase